MQSLSPERKYFYLYLLTNEKTKQCGIYEITKNQISYDTGYNIDTVSILLKYFVEAKKIAYSMNTSELAIKNWNKYNDNTSPTVQKLVKQELARVKNKTLIEYLYSTNIVSIPYPQEEEEREEEREIEKEGEGVAPLDKFLCYDIEKFLKENKNHFEVVCMNAKKTDIEVLRVLKKYHLDCQRKEIYPRKPLSLIAGLQIWLLNEKQFTNGNKGNSGEKPVPTIHAPGSFGEL